MNNELIAKYLQSKRKDKGITQAELAKVMGVTFQAVSRWEKGDSIPDIDTLGNLADYYEITIDDILQREKPVLEEDDNSGFQIPSFIFICISNFAGIGVLLFTLILTGMMWIHTVGYIFALFGLLGGVMLQQMYYFYMSDKGESAKKWYNLSYIPNGLSVLIMILAWIIL